MDNNAEREFMLVIRQAALMVRAHIKRNEATVGSLATSVDVGLQFVVYWIETKYKIKRPKVV